MKIKIGRLKQIIQEEVELFEKSQEAYDIDIENLQELVEAYDEGPILEHDAPAAFVSEAREELMDIIKQSIYEMLGTPEQQEKTLDQSGKTTKGKE
tara:strand:+ start:824 stop:1111 length:288 start_codon:yes stop_codon:yes gene_type:complete